MCGGSGASGSSNDAGVSVRYGEAERRSPAGSGSRPTHRRRSSTAGAAARSANASVSSWKAPTRATGISRDLGGDRGGELARLADDDVGPPRVDRELDAGQRRAGADAPEQLAQDELVGLVGAGGADARPHRLDVVLERIGEGDEGQARALDARLRGDRGGDEDVVAGAADCVGEGDERAEVARAGSGGEEDAHVPSKTPFVAGVFPAR